MRTCLDTASEWGISAAAINDSASLGCLVGIPAGLLCGRIQAILRPYITFINDNSFIQQRRFPAAEIFCHQTNTPSEKG